MSLMLTKKKRLERQRTEAMLATWNIRINEKNQQQTNINRWRKYECEERLINHKGIKSNDRKVEGISFSAQYMMRPRAGEAEQTQAQIVKEKGKDQS